MAGNKASTKPLTNTDTGLLLFPDLPVYRAPSRRGGETWVAFPVPARRREGTAPASMAGAIAPATAPRWHQDQPGAKAPGQRPTRPWRALLARRVGRWPAVFPDLPVYRAPCRAGRETRVAFPGPARRDERTFTASMAGAIAPATAPRWHLDRPGAKAPGQRPTRPRRALLARRVGRWPFVVLGPTDLQGTAPRGRGNAGRVSCSRPEGCSPGWPVSLAGAIAPATAPRCPLARRGPKPPASARPATGGRFAPAGSGAGLSGCLNLPVYRAPCRTGGETPCVS